MIFKMVKEKNVFIGLAIGITIAFALGCYSIFSCFVYSGDKEHLGSHIFEISYLFLHLIFCGLIFYLACRAIKLGSFFIKNLVFDYEGNVYKKKRIVFTILAIIFLVIAVYCFIQGITMKLPLADNLGKVFWHDLMNGTFVLFVCFASFVLYTFVPFNRGNKHAE